MEGIRDQKLFEVDEVESCDALEKPDGDIIEAVFLKETDFELVQRACTSEIDT